MKEVVRERRKDSKRSEWRWKEEEKKEKCIRRKEKRVREGREEERKTSVRSIG